MVRDGFFDSQLALFRSVKGFICQTGVAGDPAVHREWARKGTIKDDLQWLDPAAARPMRRGYLSFAGGGKDSRGTEFFFAYRDVALGKSPWEVPFARLIGKESYEALDHWYTGYGDIPAFGGKAPQQHRMYTEGVQYVKQNFPEMDYITSCHVPDDAAKSADEAEAEKETDEQESEEPERETDELSGADGGDGRGDM
jgi:cyclophilin family peptidyl-prolyl cis-trans isomerase